MIYLVPDMERVAQDRTMFCWYASAYMLVLWGRRRMGLR